MLRTRSAVCLPPGERTPHCFQAPIECMVLAEAQPPHPDAQYPFHAGELWAVSTFMPIRTDCWYLKRSCPCSFRLICDETNMVHFFFGIKSQLEEPPGPHGTSRKGLWCPCLSGYVCAG